MLKHVILVIILSLLAVLFMHELGYIAHYLEIAHSFIAKHLLKIFAGGTTGRIIQNTVALFIIPFVTAVIPALVYWGITRKSFLYFPYVLWAAWLILVITLAAR